MFNHHHVYTAAFSWLHQLWAKLCAWPPRGAVEQTSTAGQHVHAYSNTVFRFGLWLAVNCCFVILALFSGPSLDLFGACIEVWVSLRAASCQLAASLAGPPLPIFIHWRLANRLLP